MESLTIRQIVEQVEAGQTRIPAFQRGFVWEPERVAQLMDSIYKGYPFGALLFWRTKEQLRAEKHLGPFELPSPREDFPIDYVLDGQQRITSIYATFQTSVEGVSENDWKDIYFDYSINDNVQEPQFFALDNNEVDDSRHFPLQTLFDTTAYRKATASFGEELAKKIDNMQTRFKEVRLPIQMFRTDDKATVAVIFERINRQGVPLDTLQLLSAWTWSEDFQLQSQFAELIEEVQGKGFNIDNFDENLLLRCASAVLVTDPRPESIVSIPGEDVRSRFDEVSNGILGALDFLKMNLDVRRIENLPFQTILVPLSVYFAISGTREVVVSEEQRRTLLKWFWKVCFARRYSSGVIRHLEEDIKAILQLKGGQKSTLGGFTADVSEEFFSRNTFGIRNVNTKTFILLLAQQKPLSFVSGTPVNIEETLKDYNKTEFHHLMPKAFVKNLYGGEYSVDCLANFSFLSRSENKVLGGVRPSEYRGKMPKKVDEILSHSLCTATLFKDNFENFVSERASMLKQKGLELIQ